ncbi:MAG: hypothetical protein JSS81_27680 [Acidobacteria bacterium]|nr:hypothetical protein [Acidobacteriota bacterium]
MQIVARLQRAGVFVRLVRGFAPTAIKLVPFRDGGRVLSTLSVEGSVFQRARPDSKHPRKLKKSAKKLSFRAQKISFLAKKPFSLAKKNTFCHY